MNLSLERQVALLSNLNLRSERNGEDHVPAADLTITFDAANDILSEFDPALKSSFYRKPDAGDAQGELPVSEPGYLPKLRFPKMGAVKWEALMIGATVTVHYGTDTEKSNIVVGDARVDGWAFDLKDGGTVGVKARVACKPTPEQIAKLYTLIQSQIEITLEPPQADGQGSVE